MSDSSLAPAPATARAVLDYPLATPAEGASLEVAPGVLWLRMPLPFSLNHINLWAIKDGAGWAVVDTGVHTDACAAAWGAHLEGPMQGRPVTRVFVTHMHPDHVGLAGWLTRRFGARLWMTRLEYLMCRTMVSDTGREAPQDALDFYRRAGWSDAAVDGYRARFGNFGRHIHPLPDSFRRLSEGDRIQIGAHEWQVIVGCGHSPEHACLYCPELKLFLSGDQVLPRISSNVSVYPTEPDADPMSDWMRSLAKVRAQVPEDVLVLPSHGDAFRGLHKRIDALEQGQNRVLDRLATSLKEPKRATDVFVALFNRQITEADGQLMGMATGESVACLHYLLGQGRIARELDAQGVAWYEAV